MFHSPFKQAISREERIHAERHYGEQPPQHVFAEQLNDIAVEVQASAVVYGMPDFPLVYPHVRHGLYYEQRYYFKDKAGEFKQREHDTLAVERPAQLRVFALECVCFANHFLTLNLTNSA